MVKKYGRITLPPKKSFLGRAALADLAARARGLHGQMMRNPRTWPSAILQPAVVLETQKPIWLLTKLKPKEGVLTVSGSQTVPRHQPYLSIPQQRRTTSQLPNLVRTAGSTSHGPYSLTCWAPFFICRPKANAVTAAEEPVQGIDEPTPPRPTSAAAFRSQ